MNSSVHACGPDCPLHGGGCRHHCLKIEHISVTMGDHAILSDVSLHAHCGELTVLIGRNGAGKSTLIRAILDEIPHQGAVHFSGHDAPSRGKLRIGYVPQSLNVDKGSPATVLDMAVSLTSRWPAFLPPRKKTVEALTAHLDRFSAADLLHKPVGRLSGGELQRVLLAVATLPKPDLLVLDEPVSGVDDAGLQLFYGLIDRLRAEDMVILLISHDLDYVRRAADQVVLLDQAVLAAGTPAEVFGSEPFARIFPEKARKEAAI